MALSALRRPSSATSNAMVTRSAGSNTEIPVCLINLDTTRIRPYTWIGATFEFAPVRPTGRCHENGRGTLLHQRRRPNARDASADAAQVRTARIDSAKPDHRKHAAVLPRRDRKTAGDQAPGRRSRNQSGGRAAPAVDRGSRTTHPPPHAGGTAVDS